ncbi:MAG: tetratricopeptide repeat protein [Patescibacteria group bacterium]|jgi:Flp pilus assembly protein TadD
MDRKAIHGFLEVIEKVLLFATFFLYPLIFSTAFSNIFASTKLLLLIVVLLVLLAVKAAKIVINRKIELFSSSFDSPLFLLGVAYLVSVIISSPNKIEGLLDPTRGALMVVVFILLQLLLPSNKMLALYGSLSALFVLAVTAFGSFFGVFKFLPQSLSFVNNSMFTPIGSMLDLAFFAGYFLAVALETLRHLKSVQDKTQKVLVNVMFVLALPTILLALFIVVRTVKPVFLPYTFSWQVAVEGLKDVKNALFGVGPANYLSLFTIAKPYAYNTLQTLWSVNVEYSHSSLLQLITEVGVLGAGALALVFLPLLNAARKSKMWLPLLVIFVWTVFFPLSPTYFFLLFLMIYFVRESHKVRELDFKEVELIGYGLAGIIVLFVGGMGFLTYQVFASEYLLASSVYAASQNKAQDVYDLQRQASTVNPYNEKVRLTFSQTNMLLAQNVAQKKDLTDADKQTITTLIQQGISEAKSVVALNPQKAVYWANLAEVYRLVLSFAQQADVWTVSSYQRAIALDPKNPGYYFNLGAVYYSLKNYSAAATLFEQAATLKPDVANYFYNLAWAAYQIKDYSKAVNAMQNALQYIQAKSADYTKAQKELEEFKAMLPKEEETSTDTTTEGTGEQTLTSPSPIPTISGTPIKLPADSAPPAIPTATVTPTP